MSWTGTQPRVPGDVIDEDDHNLLLQALNELFTYNHVEGRPQPFQVDKPSILLMLLEGAASPGFPITAHVYLSPDNLIYEEVGAAELPEDTLTHFKTLTIPIPQGYYIYWTAAYAFVKSAVLF